MSFVLLGLLATGLLGAVAFDWFDWDDDNQDDDRPPDETGQDRDQDGSDLLDEPQGDETPPDDPGQVLSFDGSALLEGTEGDDTLPAGQDNSLQPEVIDLLGGDDTANIEIYDDITVNGGDGNDSITATGVTNILEGGAGNDTLSGDDSNTLNGGEGDDVLNFTHGSYDQGEWGAANGGAGDDTINLRADALIFEPLLLDVGGVDIRGGDGSDDINIKYALNELEGDLTPLNDSRSGFVRISDFNPNEDSLLIEVDQDSETVDRDVTVELYQDQREEDGTYISTIKLTFEETSESAQATNALRVLSSVPFTLDDIQLVGV